MSYSPADGLASIRIAERPIRTLMPSHSKVVAVIDEFRQKVEYGTPSQTPQLRAYLGRGNGR